MIEQNCLFDKSYRLKYLIGQGSYGKVYAANDIFLRNKCVIKIEKCDCPRPVLNKEAQFIKMNSQNFKNHKEACMRVEVPCPNNCGSNSILRKDLLSHV